MRKSTKPFARALLVNEPAAARMESKLKALGVTYAKRNTMSNGFHATEFTITKPIGLGATMVRKEVRRLCDPTTNI